MSKRTFIAVFSLLAAAVVAAEPVSATNGKITLTYDDGVVSVVAPGTEKPVAVITTGLKTDTLKAESVSHPAQKFNLLTLRGPDGSIGFKVEGTTARFTVAYNRGASPVTVKWNAAAVVLPDVYAEDEIVLPGGKARKLPPFVLLYLALLEGEDATLACIPVKAKSPALLSGDLKTLTLSSKNNEDYIFVLETGKGAWHRTLLPEKPGEFKIIDDWEPPFPALWCATVPVAEDFIPLGNGSWSTWNIVTVTEKGRPKNYPARGTMTNRETRRNWNGGFEGTYRYPAEFLDSKLKLYHPTFPRKMTHDLGREVYIYAWRRGADGNNALPEAFLPPWVAANQLQRSTNTNYGMLATTCNVTAEFEKIFYRDEAEEKTKEIAAMLKSMQCFVESIRGRIESGREWREEMLRFAAEQKTLHPALAPDADKLAAAVNEIDRLYQLDRETIKTPPDVEKLGQQVLKLAVAKLDAEAKEEQAKQLGRAIRTVGGTQDNLIAKFRHVGKCIRRLAVDSFMDSESPEAAEFWQEVYRRTEALFQGYYGHDGK